MGSFGIYKEDVVDGAVMIAVVVILVTMLCILPMIAFDVVYNQNYCETLQSLSGDAYNYKWVFWGGCLVETPDGRWVRAEDYFQIGVSGQP